MAKNEGMEKHEEFKAEFKKRVKEQAKMLYRKSLDEISDRHKFVCVAYAVKDIVIDQWIATQKAYDEKDAKIVYYLSMEFLMGRALGNNLINMTAYKEVKEALEEMNIDLNVIEDQEPDAALGNGGLGRLAACFLDSLATLNYPAYGCGIRYRYGMFKQKIKDGYQVEVPDNWLKEGNPFEIRREEYAKEVRFGGNIRFEKDPVTGKDKFIQENYESVMAVPYDMPIVGYGNHVVNTLRVWDAKPITDFKLDEFDRGNYHKAVEQENLAKLIELADAGTINSSVAKEVFEKVFAEDVDPEKYVEDHGLKTVNDEGALRTLAEEVIAKNPKAVEDFKGGKEKALGALVGQIMKAMKGKANPGMVNELLREMLK